MEKAQISDTTWQGLTYLLLIWVMNCLICWISFNLLFFVVPVNRMNTSGLDPITGHFHLLQAGQVTLWFFIMLMALWDVIFQSLMGYSSEYLIVHLYVRMHHRCILYLWISKVPEKLRPKVWATQRVLILLTCFFFFDWADFVFSTYIGTFFLKNDLIVCVKMFLTVWLCKSQPLCAAQQT